jgi:hypothetical protein
VPHVDIKIARAYRQSGETGRIHFIVVRPDGSERRLYADRASNRGLYDLLNDELLSQGYTGTKQDPGAAER